MPGFFGPDHLGVARSNAGHVDGAIAYDSSAGDYTVSGDYTFDQAGCQPVNVQVFGTSGNSLYQRLHQVNPGALSVAPTTVSVDDPSGMSLVAAFSDTDPAAVSGDFAATLAWGNETRTGVVLPSSESGGFDVYAPVTTPESGSSGPIAVTVTDTADAGGPSVTVDATALEFASGSTETLSGLPAGVVNVSVSTEPRSTGRKRQHADKCYGGWGRHPQRFDRCNHVFSR